MVQVCISTFNQTVNLIPALQHEINKLYILTSEIAQKNGWTGRLILVLKRHGINYETISEENGGFDLDKMFKLFQQHKQIEWNVSGGKKSQTMILQNLYQKRRDLPETKDYLVYLENHPFELSIYDNFQLVKKEKERVNLHLEDILNLYGYSCVQKTNLMGKEVLTYNATRLDNYSFTNSSVVNLNALFLEREEEMFRKFFFDYMYKAGWWESNETDSKDNLYQRVRDILNHYESEYQLIAQTVEKPYSVGFENLNSIVRRYTLKSSNESYRALASELKRMDRSDVLYSDYWYQIKKLMIKDLCYRINKDKPKLYIETLDEQRREDLERMIVSSGGVSKSSGSYYKMTTGKLFEEMLFSKIKEAYQANGLELNKCYVNVKTHVLQTDDKGNIEYPAEVKEHEYDDELDVVIVKNNGTLLILEAKTFGLSGDVMKSLTDSVFKKSGIFGKSIFVIPLLSYLKNEQGFYTDYVPPALISAENTFRKHGVKYFCFDEIATLIAKEIR